MAGKPIRVDPDLADHLDQLGQETGLGRNGFLRVLVNRYADVTRESLVRPARLAPGDLTPVGVWPPPGTKMACKLEPGDRYQRDGKTWEVLEVEGVDKVAHLRVRCIPGGRVADAHLAALESLPVTPGDLPKAGPRWLTAPPGYTVIGGPLEVSYYLDDSGTEWVAECVGRPGQGVSYGRGATQEDAHDGLVTGIIEVSQGGGGTLFTRKQSGEVTS